MNLGQQHFLDTSVRELSVIASPVLLQEQFPSIATGSSVLEITCTQPMLPRLERQLMGKWVIMDTVLRVWHAMSFLIMDELWSHGRMISPPSEMDITENTLIHLA